MLPLRPLDILQDSIRAIRFRPPHRDGEYNAIQRLFYVAAGALTAGAIIPGLGIWKPVQFALLTAVLGGYESAWRVHFSPWPESSGLSSFI
jgi:thiosulfate reductase cytochrome b subunit